MLIKSDGVPVVPTVDDVDVVAESLLSAAAVPFQLQCGFQVKTLLGIPSASSAAVLFECAV